MTEAAHPIDHVHGDGEIARAGDDLGITRRAIVLIHGRGAMPGSILTLADERHLHEPRGEWSMTMMNRRSRDVSRPGSVVLVAAALALLATALPIGAQRPEPEIFGEFAGDPMYTVLEPDAIPAIRDPSFVTGRAAAAQMKANEPVIGVVVDGEAHAYSTWQLDAHEIVNDRIAGTAIAAT